MRIESQKHRNSAGNGEAGADRPNGVCKGSKAEKPTGAQSSKIYHAGIAKRGGETAKSPADPEGSSRLTGRLVRSEAGHDKGGVFVIVGVREDGAPAKKPGSQMVLLADGKERRLEKPKAKKLRHLTVLTERPLGRDELAGLLRSPGPMQNAELRKLIARSLEGGAGESPLPSGAEEQ